MKIQPHPVLIFGLLAILATTAYPHALHPESMDRHTDITITPSKIALIYQVICGTGPTDRYTTQLDRNKDGAISDDERNAFVESLARQFAKEQTLQIGETQLELHYHLGDIYGTLGHNGILALKIDIAYVCDLPKDLPRGAALPFSYRDGNFTDVSSWKQLNLQAQGGAQFDGFIPYREFKPFDYELVNTKGFFPATTELNGNVTLPEPSQGSGFNVVMPERNEYVPSGNLTYIEQVSLYIIPAFFLALVVIPLCVFAFLRFRSPKEHG